MGPPLRSFAADAHDCIMVWVLGPTGYKVVARLIRAQSGLPLIVIPTAASRAVVLEAVKVWPGTGGHAARLARRPTLTAPARADVSKARVGTKKRAFRSNKETGEKKQDAPPWRNSLTKKAPYKEIAVGGAAAVRLVAMGI